MADPFEVKVGGKYYSDRVVKEIEVLFIDEETQSALVKWESQLDGKKTTAMRLEDIRTYYWPGIFRVGVAYIGPRSGREYDCIWADEKYSILRNIDSSNPLRASHSEFRNWKEAK